MAFDPRVVAAAPWSLSKGNVLVACTKQYHKKYVLKEKGGRKSTESRVGVTAHTVQEFALNRAPDYDTLLGFAREQIEKDGLTHDESVEVTARLHGVADFARRVADLKVRYGVRKELVEAKLAMTADWTPCDFFDKRAFLRGVLDYGLLTASGVLLLVDHKSGKRKRIGEHAPQFYTYMDLALVNFPAGEVDGVQSAINYLGAPDLDWFPRFDGTSGPWTRHDIATHAAPWLEAHLNRLTKRLDVVSSGAVRAEVGWQCDYCDYLAACPEGQDESAKRRAKREAKSGN